VRPASGVYVTADQRRQPDAATVEAGRVAYRQIRRRLRREVIERDGPACAYCGQPNEGLDHLRPIGRGGHPTALQNVVAACHKCNSGKRDRLPQAWLTHLRATASTVEDHHRVRTVEALTRRLGNGLHLDDTPAAVELEPEPLRLAV